MQTTVELGANKSKTIRSSETRTYAYLLCGARAEVESAQLPSSSPNEILFKSVNALILTAFFVEAYLNHLGAEKLENWEVFEKKLSPKEKLTIIASEIGFELDFSRRPCQCFKEVFDTRNEIAHGKTRTTTEVSNRAVNIQEFASLGPSWESKCTPQNVKLFFNEMESLIKSLHLAAELDLNTFSHFSVGFIMERQDS